MINPIKNIVENMGFVMVSNEYMATFEDVASGNYVDVIVKEVADENGVNWVQFHSFDEHGEFLGMSTLDQMMEAVEINYNPVCAKTNATYYVKFNVSVKIPVIMENVSRETYKYWLNEGYTVEESIAERIARSDFEDAMVVANLELITIDTESIENVKA